MQVWVNWVIWVKNYDLENLGKLLLLLGLLALI
jgi:hypothetical protein